MALISSSGNPRIKAIRALRSRDERERTGLFFAEGLRIVTEALQLKAGVATLVVAPQLLRGGAARRMVAEQADAGAPLLEVTAEVFESLSARDGPAGLGAVVRQHWESLFEISPAEGRCWIALEGVQDPGNLGTILRSSDAAGGAGVILLGAATDPYHPTAVRASMGAIFSQRLIRADLNQIAAWSRRNRCTVIGASGAAARDYRAVVYRPPVVLLMGSEQHGLSPESLDLCHATARIPMLGRSDSLNLAVATSLLLYEALRQCPPPEWRHSGPGA